MVMNIYFKIFIFFVAMLIDIKAKSQQLLCWKSEKIKYDWNLNEYLVLFSEISYDSVVIDKFHIQIKSKDINLTKRREMSKWSDKTGITTIYETVSSSNKIVTVHVIETKQGISKLVLMESSNSEYGTAYNFMGSKEK